ncbi:hypothetical protein ES708_35094 [subsurface metagenome]
MQGVQGGAELNRFALEKNFSRIFHVYAGKDLDQCGFARSVFANKGMSFIRSKGKIHLIQSFNSGKLFADFTHLQNNLAVHTHDFISLSRRYDLRPGYLTPVIDIYS